MVDLLLLLAIMLDDQEDLALIQKRELVHTLEHSLFSGPSIMCHFAAFFAQFVLQVDVTLADRQLRRELRRGGRGGLDGHAIHHQLRIAQRLVQHHLG